MAPLHAPGSQDPPPDAELVAACRRGDPGAWERLVQRFERLIFTVPRRAGLGPDEAADVFQTVFMRLHERLDELSQPDRVQAWLVTTAKRETLRLLELQRRSPPPPQARPTSDDDGPAPEPELVDPDPLPEELLDDLQQRQRVRLAFMAIGEPCHSLLKILYFADEPVPYSEISARLGMPIGSIGPTRARCLAKLRDGMNRKPSGHRDVSGAFPDVL